MRCEKIKSTHKLKIPIGRPDRNGNLYSKEAIHDSLYTIIDKPFGAYVGGVFTPLGIVTDWAYVDETDDWIEVEIETEVFHGGTSETVDIDDDYICHVTNYTDFGFSDD